MLTGRWLAVATCLTLASCSAAPRAPLIVAHRGASHDRPENTLAAFEQAWALDADAVEGDFRLTLDGEIVTMHDDTAERTAGAKRDVATATLDELRELEVGAWFGEPWAGEPVPTLQEVLDTVPPGGRIFIEIKSDARIVPALARLLEASPLQRDQLVIIAFDPVVIEEVKLRLPWITACWLCEFERDGSGRWRPTAAELIETARRIDADGVDVHADTAVVDETFVSDIHGAGLQVHVWTVNDGDTARRMADVGVDSITTDRPDLVRVWLMGSELE